MFSSFSIKEKFLTFTGQISNKMPELPNYVKHLSPDIEDKDILPASLSKEVVTGLLREKLNFNGLIVTDAATMAGMSIPMPREKAVPLAISTGCDMFLLMKNMEEDIGFMKAGV